MSVRLYCTSFLLILLSTQSATATLCQWLCLERERQHEAARVAHAHGCHEEEGGGSDVPINRHPPGPKDCDGSHATFTPVSDRAGTSPSYMVGTELMLRVVQLSEHTVTLPASCFGTSPPVAANRPLVLRV